MAEARAFPTPGARASGVVSGSALGSGTRSSIGPSPDMLMDFGCIAAPSQLVVPSRGLRRGRVRAPVHHQQAGRSSHNGCRLRHLRQAPGLRDVGELLAQAQPSPLEPERPADPYPRGPQAARVLAAIMRKALGGEPDQALGMFDQAYQPLLGVSQRVVSTLTDEQLISLLTSGSMPDLRRVASVL